LKWFLFKLAFFYPRLYAFFCYYRKKERRREFEEKVLLFYEKYRDPKKVEEIVKGVFELRGGRKMQRYLIPLIDTRFIRRFVTVEGLDHLNRAINEGRGVLLMAGHIGNPHIGFNILRRMGYEVTIMKGGAPKRPKYRKFRYTDPQDYTVFVRNATLSKGSKEGVSEILRSGGIFYYTADATAGKRKVVIPFLGRSIGFPTGTIHLAHQAKAVVLPFIHLYRRGKIGLIFKDPIDGGWINGEGDYRRIISEFSKLLESYILEYPEEYMGIYGDTVLDDYYRSGRGKEDELGV
jgi:Kdo2-lipid IVA lauroyltransferase/acyltransferase